jgi:flagellin
MGLRINTNVSSTEALRNLNATDRAQRKSMERLSTGLRINSASDDPSGLVISEQLRAQIASLGQASKNSQNASNLVGTAEAALNEVSGLLTQIRQSVVFAMNSNSTEEISAEQDSVDNAISSIDRIAQTTKFANRKLLDGSSAIQTTSTLGSGIAGLNVQNIQFDGVTSLTMKVNLTALASRAGGAGLFASAFTSANATTIVRITGTGGTTDISLASGANAANFKSAVNAFTGNTGVYVSAGRLYSVDFGADQTISLEVVSGSIDFGTQTVTSASGIKSDSGHDAAGNIQGASVSAKGNSLKITSDFFTGSVTLKDGVALNANLTFKVRKSGLNFELNTSQAASDQERIGIRSMASSSLGANTRTIPGQAGNNVTIGGFLSSLKSGGTNDLRTNPDNALRIIDNVINQVSDARAYLGAFQKMTLDSNTSSLAVATENLTSSQSTIRDVDFAAETSEYTRTQVLFQSGTYVLAQANQNAQTVLTLLR